MRLGPRRWILLLTIVGCTGNIGEREMIEPPNLRPVDPFQPLAAGLRTLTPAQYAASTREVLGLADSEGPIAEFGQWPSSIAAARGGFAPTTVETYESIARDAARFMFEDTARRDALLGCAPSAECSRTFVARVGRRAFRRTLTDEEVTRWAAVADSVGVSLGDPYAGLEHALSGLLQSPHFLYRVELGEPVVPEEASGERLAYTDHEMATRLAFFIWNRTPDEALLDAADMGALSTEEDIAAQVRRMVDDPRALVGLREFLAELLDASAIDGLEKNPAEFPSFDETLAVAMREQLVQSAADAVRAAGYRSLFTTRTFYVNDQLAPLLDLEPVYGGALTPVTLDASSPRAGVLTMPGYLALHTYPGKTSPALRGLFVRQRLLCHEIPPPPAGVDTTLPERPEGELVTTRELVAMHQELDSCGACHRLMDPIGLGLEEFDAIGVHRTTENMLDIDPSGVLEDRAFEDAVGLGEVVASHPALLPCLIANLYAFGAANTVAENDPALDPILEQLIEDDLTSGIVAIATSDLFRFGYPEAP